jgi:hypothetical protein
MRRKYGELEISVLPHNIYTSANFKKNNKLARISEICCSVRYLEATSENTGPLGSLDTIIYNLPFIHA